MGGCGWWRAPKRRHGVWRRRGSADGDHVGRAVQHAVRAGIALPGVELGRLRCSLPAAVIAAPCEPAQRRWRTPQQRRFRRPHRCEALSLYGTNGLGSGVSRPRSAWRSHRIVTHACDTQWPSWRLTHLHVRTITRRHSRGQRCTRARTIVSSTLPIENKRARDSGGDLKQAQSGEPG